MNNVRVVGYDAVEEGGSRWLRRWVWKSHRGSILVGVGCVSYCYPVERDDVVKRNG